jgi:hypothetical protein
MERYILCLIKRYDKAGPIEISQPTLEATFLFFFTFCPRLHFTCLHFLFAICMFCKFIEYNVNDMYETEMPGGDYL